MNQNQSKAKKAHPLTHSLNQCQRGRADGNETVALIRLLIRVSPGQSGGDAHVEGLALGMGLANASGAQTDTGSPPEAVYGCGSHVGLGKAPFQRAGPSPLPPLLIPSLDSSAAAGTCQRCNSKDWLPCLSTPRGTLFNYPAPDNRPPSGTVPSLPASASSFCLKFWRPTSLTDHYFYFIMDSSSFDQVL
uniref:Uncharacterized protein n=1 Tax=Physcomitrium patens TaxID=3218 RepID=A0A2K1JHY1_PHYPA|nr:hypothetical protein PHYPA_018561 [Physcomitrium patens]